MAGAGGMEKGFRWSGFHTHSRWWRQSATGAGGSPASGAAYLLSHWLLMLALVRSCRDKTSGIKGFLASGGLGKRLVVGAALPQSKQRDRKFARHGDDGGRWHPQRQGYAP